MDKMYECIIPQNIKHLGMDLYSSEIVIKECNSQLNNLDQDAFIAENNIPALQNAIRKELERLDAILEQDGTLDFYKNIIVAHRNIDNNKKQIIILRSIYKTERPINWLD